MAITQNNLAEYKHWQPEMTKIIDGQPVRFCDVCVHEIRMADVEDPDLFVANPIWEWQQTLPGKFVMEHAVEKPYWINQFDHSTYGHVYKIIARLSEQNETFWRLLCLNKKLNM
jgi:hypothetical protein